MQYEREDFMKDKRPLVSIMIPNRNHSMFLGQCIESALNQTYENVDIAVLDNCSDDNSIEIASKYIDKGIRVCKNPRNIGNKSYDILALLAEGKYMILLCADDLIKPTLVEKCVNIMEKYPNVGYVHCDRDYIDTNNNITDLDPFYNCSFISQGKSALPIYMLTDVGQPAQCLIRRSTFHQVFGYNTEFDHTNADKDLWFRLSLISDYAYIRDKLSLIRIHEARETASGFRNFYHPLAIYMSLSNQVKLGEHGGYQNVLERLPVAHQKLASECVQIAFSCLKENNKKLIKQYMLFARIIHAGIVHDDKYKELSEICSSIEINGNKNMQLAEPDLFVRRKRNYNPPEGFKRIEVQDYE
jgi:glycosyltransferase involved in cell wall biosynthesis